MQYILLFLCSLFTVVWDVNSSVGTHQQYTIKSVSLYFEIARNLTLCYVYFPRLVSGPAVIALNWKVSLQIQAMKHN